jgi:hypothetical protein|uniref:Uncharacterized protein n=1 Tax=Siphoviridae sp. ctrzs15 TaxID=2825691 RepID=A0A8S5Q5I5_9CAUD|nr:MAG TPA: hypothetical protein [Siphoviridae sp. ctrzs15]
MASGITNAIGKSKLQEKDVTITQNGTTEITPDSGYDGMSKATIITNVPSTPTEEKTVALSMASGNQVITPTSGKVLSKVTITKPSTMLATNIKKDVNIGGVVGTYEGVILPTYNGLLRFTSAPTISLSNSTLTITAVANATSYAIYSNNALLTTITTTSVDLSTLITTAGTYTIYAIAKATGYVDSEKSNEVSYTAASGYSVSVSEFDRISAPTQFYYSIDNGVNWVEITETGLLTSKATQLKFRITYEGKEIQPSGSISSVQAGISASYHITDFGYNTADEQSENVTLTQNITDIICR